jgi:hypothetical protein
MLGASFVVAYQSGTIKDHISTTVDSLDMDNRLHIGIIVVTGSYYVCLAQKTLTNINYAAGLVFSYNNDKILFQRKAGSWQTVREI